MNESQKALDRIETNFCACCFDQYISPCDCPAKEDFEIIKKDLERLEKLEKVIKILKDRLIDYQGMEFQKCWYDGEEEYHYFLVFDENFEIELVDENQFKFLKEVFEDE